MRQICWAHLKRDFQKLVDRGGPAEAIGRVGLEVVECLFADWWAFRRGELDRPGLQARLGSIRARTPRRFGARLLVRGFQGGDLLRQSVGTLSGVVVVRVDRRCRAHEQPCGTHPANGRVVAEECFRLSQPGGMSVRGADADRGPNPAVAETSGAGLPVSRDRGPSVRPSRSAITGPRRGLNGYANRKVGAVISVRALAVGKMGVCAPRLSAKGKVGVCDLGSRAACQRRTSCRLSGWGAPPHHSGRQSRGCSCPWLVVWELAWPRLWGSF